MPEFFPAFRAERNKKPILFKNAKIYDGSDVLSGPKDVLVVGNLIQDVEQSISGENWGAVSIDCSGYTLMPGLIDMHLVGALEHFYFPIIYIYIYWK